MPWEGLKNSGREWRKKKNPVKRKKDNFYMPDIDAIKEEYEILLQKLSDPGLSSNWEKFEELSERKKYLDKIIEKDAEFKELKKRSEENKLIIATQEDSELVSLAETESITLAEKEKRLEKELKNLISNPYLVKENKPENDFNALIIEIREGTGGEEAGLFAGNLFNMYSKYAQNMGWRLKVLDSSPTELGGFKEIIFEIKGSDVFSKMKYEGGVHRVQRIPKTEKSGRIHTSTATVAVLPEPKKAQIKINPNDLKVDYYHSSGPGGQNVNKRETAVRITHLPTGIVATSQTQRHLLENKQQALAILEAKILRKQKEEENEKILGKRKSQIGGAERSEKIRTYNFPQDRTTDHRIKKSWHNIAEIMEGNLNSIIEALQKSEEKLED